MHKQVTTKLITSWILPKLKQQPHYRPSAMVIDFKTEFGIDIEYSKAPRGKECALEMIHGTFEDVYKAMPHPCADIEVINPGSIASLEEIFIHRRGYFCSFQIGYFCSFRKRRGYLFCVILGLVYI